MDIAIYSIAGIAAILLAAAMLVVWSRRDIPRLRGTSIGLAMLATVVASAVILSTLGNAVPLIGGITAPPGDAPLLSAKAVTGKGIYVTIDLPDGPKLFWLPWDMRLAEKLQDMINNPGNAGVMTKIPQFEFSWDTRPPSFQPVPQPKWIPDKPPEAPQAPHFSA